MGRLNLETVPNKEKLTNFRQKKVVACSYITHGNHHAIWGFGITGEQFTIRHRARKACPSRKYVATRYYSQQAVEEASMKIARGTLMLAAIAVMATPVAALADPAVATKPAVAGAKASKSLAIRSGARASADMGEASQLSGESLAVTMLAVIAAGLGVAAALSNGEDPVSP